MKLHRSLLQSRFIANFVRVTDHQLGQLKVIRWLAGGVWVKYDGTWTQVAVMRQYADGSLLLSMSTYDETSSVTFHSTNYAVAGLEDYR